MTTSAPHTIGTAPAATPGEGPSAQLGRVVQRDWALWVDWCAATDRDPHHGAIPDLASFLFELPATSGVQDRRVRSIVRTLTGTGHVLPRPTTAAPVRLGPQWASQADALAALRQEWYPEGVAARRDALILVLTAAGFTRTRITTLRPPQITTLRPPQITTLGSTLAGTVGDGAGVTVDGVDLPRTADPVLCPRCALTRWAQVLGAFADRSRYDVEDLLTAARDHHRPRHDCADLPQPHDQSGDRWRQTAWVFPAIDRHGAIQPTAPMTARALTAVLARRYNAAAVRTAATAAQPDHPTPQPPQPAPAPSLPVRHRPGREDHAELEALWEQAEEAADELNARILRLLDDL